MSEIIADGGPLPVIPDNLTIPQFMLDVHHPARPVLKQAQPWCIDELTGREVCSDEVSARLASEHALLRCGRAKGRQS